MPQPKSLYSDEINDARDELRGSLAEVAPKKPFGPNLRGVVRAIDKDPRIAKDVLNWMRFQALANGADLPTATKMTEEQMRHLRETFGREAGR